MLSGLTNPLISQLKNPLVDPLVGIGVSIPTVDLWVQIGQSNADGRGNVSSLPSVISTFYSTKQTNLWMYQKNAARSSGRVPASYFVDDGEWWNLAPRYDATSKETSMTINDTAEPATENDSDTIHGVEVPYGYAWAQANPTRELRMLKIAIGGSTIDGTWEIETDAGDDDGIWHFFENYIWTPALADIEAEGKRLGRVYFYWMQGESDASVTLAPSYQGHLETLVTKINGLSGYTGTKQIIIGQLSLDGYVGNGPSPEAQWNVVKAAQETVANANSNVELFITDGTGNYPEDDLSVDNLHWDSSALVTQGYRLYAFSAPTAPVSVSDLTVNGGNLQADLTWSLAFGARSYKVQYKLASSSTWITDATVYIEQTGYIITGLTNDVLYDFRVVAVNNIGETNGTVVQETPGEDPLTNANTVVDLSAQYASSYSGTGETWTNVATGTSEPDAWLGIDGTTDGTEPTFVGTAGTSGAYFELDDANDEVLTLKSQTTLTQNLHRSDSTQAYTIMCHFYLDDQTNRYILGTSQVGTTAGMVFQVATSNENLRIRFYNSSGAILLTVVTTTAQLTPNANNVVGFAYDPNDSTWETYVNGTAQTGTHGAYTNTGSNQGAMTIGADVGSTLGLDQGCRILNFAMFDAKLTGSEMTTAAGEMTSRVS